MEVNQTWENIQYDAPLDRQLFVPPPPNAPETDLEPADAAEQMARPSEADFLDALRAYPQQIRAALGERFVDQLPHLLEQTSERGDAEAAQVQPLLGDIQALIGQGYPPQLDSSFLASVALKVSVFAPSLERARELAARAQGDEQALARQVDERAAAAGDAEAAARVTERQEPAREELDRKLNALSRSIVTMQAFHQQLLIDGCEPEYFGATVKPGDSAAVLMRWRSESGDFRVIYGDLRAETVTTEPQPGETP
jgi:hypothetical protein